MSGNQPPAVAVSDEESAGISVGGIRRAAYALFVSAAVHAAIFVLLSLIAMTISSDTNPIMTMLMDRTDGAALEPQFAEVPDLEIKPPSETSPPPSESTAEQSLTETETAISDAFFNNGSSATETTTASGNADSAEVSAIQSRVKQAGGKKGEVQFALAWKDKNDIDLHVVVPSGERISYNHKQSRCRGELDVDMNVDGESEQPVENVRWLPKRAPSGRYTILVNLYRVHDQRFNRRGRSEYQLLANLGTESEIVEDFVAGGRSVRVHRFVYVPYEIKGRRRKVMLDRMDRLQEDDERRAKALLERATAENGLKRQEKLQELANKYPHSDAAIEALKMMSGVSTKP